MSDDEQRHAGYDDALDAIADGDPYALVCPAGHRSMPPARVCPECGETPLERTPLPTRGALLTYNVTHVPTPEFATDAPYVLGIADFDGVWLTGRVDAAATAVTVGADVELRVGTTATTGRRTIVFDLVAPRE